MSSSNKNNRASEYILDPFNEPTRSEETGPGSSSQLGTNAVASTVSQHTTGNSTSTNPFRRTSTKLSKKPSQKSSGATTHTREINSGNLLNLPTYSDEPTRRSAEHSRPSLPSSTRPRRSSSLRERYPGDTSHRPLATLTHDNKVANRSPHLRKKHLHGSDIVDKLDQASLGSYHHGGPFDAASLARNNSFTNSPVAALDGSNKEALRATARDKIEDSLRRQRPLDGVAYVPPGQPDRFGRVYHYKEGTNLMIEEGGDYKRWPGLDYLPEDLKGKGEPSYSIEKRLKEQRAMTKKHMQRSSSGGSPGAADGTEFELLERSHKPQEPTTAKDGEEAATTSGAQQSYRDWEEGRRRSGSGAGARISGEFKRRFGSLSKKDGRVPDGVGNE